ncbi:hypothetical protein AC629_24240 [Bradyrhizobium sp. NAS80.1]|nr:hypothetical protein AC629_24240 [Bradyrhizobium sp. NAS80.1]
MAQSGWAEQLGNPTVKLDATSDLIPLMYSAGNLREAIKLCEQTMRDNAMTSLGGAAAGLLNIRLGHLLYETNKLDRSHAMLEMDLRYARAWVTPTISNLAGGISLALPTRTCP